MASAQSSDHPIWLVELIVPAVGLPAFQGVLDEFVDAVTIFEVDGGTLWRISGYAEAEPDRRAIEAAAAAAASASGLGAPGLRVEQLAARDWVAENRRLIQPVAAGRFFIRPSHFDGPTPDGLIGIELDAGPAFGSGTHETTRGCLELISRVDGDVHPPRRIIDLGTGSGILAIAMALLWDREVLGLDLDPIAIETARENGSQNGAEGLLSWETGDVLEAGLPPGDWDLAVANILAGPLVALAPMLARSLAADGQVILSGILADQADEVRRSYEAEGLAVIDTVRHGEWPTLLMRRGA